MTYFACFTNAFVNMPYHIAPIEQILVFSIQKEISVEIYRGCSGIEVAMTLLIQLPQDF